MKLETVKTFILTILIGISLLLSVAIWNYQPNYGPLQPKYVSQVDIGGGEVMKRSIIQPYSVTFHKKEKVYRFSEETERKPLYDNLQEWMFTNLSIVRPPNVNNINEYVELTFPLSIQLKMVSNMFSLNDDVDDLPNWTFKKMLIVPNENYATLDVYFLSINGQHAARFVVNESDAYWYITSILDKEHRLKRQLLFGTEDDPIYIPEKNVKMKRRSLAIEYIDPALLVNALFENPSLVSHTIGESNYNDGQRMMVVLNDGRSMEFTNPMHSNDHIHIEELIDLSIRNINEHKGWTNDYILEEVDSGSNRVQYKMYYDAYPVYSHEDYSMIEQQWKNQELYQYKRPLFKLTNLLNSDTVTLPSGEEVIDYLYENDNYQINNITDIRLGYRLKYEEDLFSVTLDPTWYLHYNDRWIELKVTTSDLLGKGGL